MSEYDEAEWLIFPVRNEQDFKVNSWEAYWHMIDTIVAAQTELVEDYPEEHILVTFLVGEEDA